MGEIIKSVRVNGIRVKALVDTGASDNYLSARIAKRVRLFLEGDESFITADGRKLKGKLAHVTIDIAKRQGSTSVVVTNILPQDGYDLVLGQTFLQDNEVNLNFSKDSLTYGGHQPKIRKLRRL